MSLKEWAEEEVKIACQKENPDRKNIEWYLVAIKGE